MKYLISVAFLFLTVSCTSVDRIDPDEMFNAGISASQFNRIKENQYSTYVTFLSANTFHFDTVRDERIKSLKKSFTDFAEGIGNKSLAIWLSGAESKNIQRLSKSLHDSYQLPYGGGPYIIVTDRVPLRGDPAPPGLILDFSNVKPERIHWSLDELQQTLRGQYPSYHRVQFVHSREILVSAFLSMPDGVKNLAAEISKELIKASISKK